VPIEHTKGAPIVGRHQKERKGDREPDPILKLRNTHLHAEKVIEREASEREDGDVYPPQVSILWDIVKDGKNGEYDGVKFWDKYSFVKSYDDPTKYVIREDTRIGDLAAFVAYEFYDGADYFEDDGVDIDFEELEGADVTAQLEPRRFKEQAPTGTRTVSKTLQLAEKAEKVAAGLRQSQQAASEAAKTEEDEDFEDIPF
jgi:hypothetical protein